jgi:hypothetical protein
MFGRNFSLYRPSERKHFHLPIHFVALAVLGASIWILGIIFFSHSALQSHPIQKSKNVVSPHAVAAESDDSLENLWPDDLHDADFFESLHSCYDDCHPNKTPSTKIGLLFPPGAIGLMFLDFVQTVARSHVAATKPYTEALWIPTSHLPASNHENDQQYTHILRFANLPLLLAVGDALLHVTTTTNNNRAEEITWLDVQETTQLLVIWHCQLSHLADQKSLPILTMTMEQLAEDPVEQELYLREFLPALDNSEDDDAGEVHIDDDGGMVNSLDQVIARIKVTLQAIDQKLQKEKGQRLEASVNRIVKAMMLKGGGDDKCPPGLVDGPLFTPRSPMAQRVHQLLQKGKTYKDDQDLCQKDDSTLSNSLFCKTLTPPFNSKSLIDESKQKGD